LDTAATLADAESVEDSSVRLEVPQACKSASVHTKINFEVFIVGVYMIEMYVFTPVFKQRHSMNG
jgi:hypothetical protein